MSGCRRLKNHLTDYCENSSLTGFAYLSNQQIHVTERLFWLTCIILSTAGSYYLIREYQYTFDSNAISLILEGTRPQDISYFPGIAVCEIDPGYGNSLITKYVQGLFENATRSDNQFDIEEHMTKIIFQDKYGSNLIGKHCDEFLNCTDCVQCLTEGYADIAKQIRLNCSELMESCTWNGKPFNCCHFFRPLQAPYGSCYAMNSLQATTRNGPHWFKSEIRWQDYKAVLALKLRKLVELSIQNVEDIPIHLIREDNMFNYQKGSDIQFTMRSIINDPGVRDIPPEYRNCRFPDEQFKNSSYEYYSFKTCITDCIKQAQLKACNCTNHNMVVKSDDKSPACGFKGWKCLDAANLVKPNPYMLQPWQEKGLHCKCLPSCTDHEIIIIEDTEREHSEGSTIDYTITQVVSTEQYRRQSVRTNLDVVVAFGGILGLFMGASVLSGLEIFYFFLVRCFTMKK